MTDTPGDDEPTTAWHRSARERLASERAATEEHIAALGKELTGIIEANALVAVDDEHDPEGSSTAFERAHTTALLKQARNHLNDLDRAVERWEQGHYGRCETCGEPIPTERLEARPTATTCITCAAGGTRQPQRPPKPPPPAPPP